MVKVTYVGPHDAVDVPALDRAVKNGETVDVDADIAGKPPKEDDPGSGLLAQTDNWAAHKKGDD